MKHGRSTTEEKRKEQIQKQVENEGKKLEGYKKDVGKLVREADQLAIN